MILVDTSVLSFALRRSRRGAREERVAFVLLELLHGDEVVAIPGIVLQEILSGTRTTQQFASLRRSLLESYLLQLADQSDHETAARILTSCRSRGANASAVDCLIAAQAIGCKAELFAADADFERIARHSRLKLLEGW